MGTQGTGRKRSTKKERSTAEDDALNLIAREAEARLAAKRAARAEAREIRMKELERQQKEFSDDDERMSVGSRGSVKVDDRDYLEKGSRAASALTAATLTSLGGTSSRRGSGETAITVDAETSIREIKDALTQVEEKYRKAMVSNAQLDNEKNNLMYQVDTLKDSLMELEELLSESRREYEEKAKDYEREKHAHSVLQFQFNEVKETLKQSEELLNKHGIVLDPDLNINGDVGEAKADGSSTAEPASQPTQDAQTTSTEGNSMLGNTEALRSSKEEELNPELQQEKLQEAKENHSNPDTVCKIDVCSENEQLPEEQIRLQIDEDKSLKFDFTTNTVENSAIETKVIDTGIPEFQLIVSSPEENVTESEIFKEGNLKDTNDTNLVETELESQVDGLSGCKIEISSNLPDKQDNKSNNLEESDLINTEPCHQQTISPVTTESLPDESVSTISHTEATKQSHTKPQQEADTPEEAEKIEEVVNNSNKGKKKKRKKKGKKKGAAENETKDQDKSEKSTKSEEKSSVPPAESNTETSKVDGVMNEPGDDTVLSVKVTDSFPQKESKEPGQKLASKEHDDEQTLDGRISNGVAIASLPEQTLPKTVEDKQDQMVETQLIEPVENNVETPKELREKSTKEETEQSQKPEEVNKMETETGIDQDVNTFASDIDSSSFSLDRSDTGGFFNNGEVIIPEPDRIVEVEDEVQPVNETACEFSITNEPETSYEENPDVPNTSNIPLDDFILESKGQTVDSLINDTRSCCETLNSGGDDLPVLDIAPAESTINDEEKPEPEHKCFPLSVAGPSHESTELIQGATGRDEMENNTESGELVDPERCSHHGRNVPIMTSLEDLNTGTVVQEEQLQETRTVEDKELVEESGVKNMSEYPEGNKDIGSPNSMEITATDLEKKSGQHDEGFVPFGSLLSGQVEVSTTSKGENIQSSQLDQLASQEEEDDREEEGRSFDFDDMDEDVAVDSDFLKNPDEDAVEESLEVMSDESNVVDSGRCQADSLSDNKTQDKPIDSMEEEVEEDVALTSVDELHKGDESVVEKELKPVIEEEKGFNVAELGVVVQNIKDTVSSLVEEALDVVTLDFQDKVPDSTNSTDQVASSSKGPQQAGREGKKSGKKGKGKGKEDCKMS